MQVITAFQEWTSIIIEKSKEFSQLNSNKKIKYYNIPCSFDIETSSFRTEEDEKVAILYAFALDINHTIYIGRDYHDLTNAINFLKNNLNLSMKHRMVFYVHNLSYEFQFIRKHFEWDKIFAIEERKMIYAITDGIEFRCSYLQSGYSLARLAEVRNLPIKKLVGDLDYRLLRTPLTPLEEKEINYLINDVEILIYYIDLLIKEEQNIAYIPITKTAYVRRHTRNKCKSLRYKKLIKTLTIEPMEYEMLKAAFQGGFTHGNIYNVGIKLKNIASYDFTSSYPAVMVSEMFPMSKGELLNNPSNEDIQDSLNYYCCIINLTYDKLESKEIGDHPLSSSKCDIEGKRFIDNGRIVTADKVNTTITEQDLMTIEDFYNFEDCTIHKIIRYRKNYLPKEFVETILELYQKKTELKGVEGREDEYMNSKEMINSMYGMCVTDILRDEILYTDDEWGKESPNIEEALTKYNKSYQRFLFYPWGVWVTAYARRNLFTAIKEIGIDYVYADTDSVKIMNPDKHKKYFDDYNFNIKRKIKRCLNKLHIDEELAHPKTIKGEEKWLGVWEYEGTYKFFKTLGAKRYMTFKDKLSITVSGLNKEVAVPYIMSQCEIDEKFSHLNRAFNFFSDGMYIPKGYTGRSIHTYIDYQKQGVVTDYMGIEYNYNELSSIHLEESDYSLSLARDVINFILRVRAL